MSAQPDPFRGPFRKMVLIVLGMGMVGAGGLWLAGRPDAARGLAIGLAVEILYVHLLALQVARMRRYGILNAVLMLGTKARFPAVFGAIWLASRISPAALAASVLGLVLGHLALLAAMAVPGAGWRPPPGQDAAGRREEDSSEPQ